MPNAAAMHMTLPTAPPRLAAAPTQWSDTALPSSKRKSDTAAADAAPTPADNTPAPDGASEDSDTAMQPITDAANAAADNTPVDTAPTADGAVELLPELAALAALDGALAKMPDGHPARAALVIRRAAAEAALHTAQTLQALDEQRQREVQDARDTAAEFALDADVLADMLAAVEAKYAPAPAVEPEPEPQVPARRAPSERTLSANAAAATDAEYAPRAAAAVEAFDKDSGALACTVNRRPNTRFSGMLALAPSSTGVANYADYDRLTRAIRHHLITVKRWQVSDSDGQSVPEAKWLASRGRYVLGGGVKSALACFHSGAEIAQYADGRFRFALPNTPNVKWLRTDNAAYSAFVGGAAPSAPAPATVSDAPAPPRHTPTPPTPPERNANASGAAQSDTLPQHTLTTSARCQFCTARNVTDAAECVQCGESEWLLA